MLWRALSSSGARGKFGEHERSVRVARGDSRGQLYRQYQKGSLSEVIRDDTDAESPFLLFFAFSASRKNSSPRGKVAKLSLFLDWWAKSLFLSIIVAR